MTLVLDMIDRASRKRSWVLAFLAVFSLFHPFGSIANAQNRNATELIFDQSTNKWVRKPTSSGSVVARYRRSDASPIARQIAEFPNRYAVGTVIIDTGERRLYRILSDTKAMRYAIGVGRDGFAWRGEESISRKAEWPSWTPPREMREREARLGRVLPVTMEGGPGNPLGARALYLGSTLYRIHGTNQPWTIGQAISSGCIRMANDDVVHLYEAIKVGDLVVVR